MSKAKRSAWRDLTRTTQSAWVDKMVKQLNMGFATRYGPSAYTPPEASGSAVPKSREEKLTGQSLHYTKGWGPPYGKLDGELSPTLSASLSNRDSYGTTAT